MGYTREMPQVTKDKIRNSLQGRKLSDEVKAKISAGVKSAWSKVSKKTELWATTENNDNNTNDDEKEENKI